MKRPNARAFILLLSVISVVLAGLLIQEIMTECEPPIELEQLSIENTDLKFALNKSERLTEIDEFIFFEGDWETALEELKSELEGASDGMKTRLQRRIDFITQAFNEQRNGDERLSEKDQLIRNQRNRLERLELQIDSTRGVLLTRQDSLKTLITALRDEIRTKDNALKKKDKVQVVSFTGAKGARIHYLGEVENGKANGGGVGIWSTGSVYRCEWKDNLRHGKGTFEWVDGERYEGDYVEGRREGDGVYYWPSGERYEGQWLNDRREGDGILYDMDGNIRFEGRWSNDKPLTN